LLSNVKVCSQILPIHLFNFVRNWHTFPQYGEFCHYPFHQQIHTKPFNIGEY
jgi:hypothetical protein